MRPHAHAPALLIAAAGLLAGSALVSRPARAQDDQVIAQVQQLKNEALAAFDSYAYRKGTRKLEQAIKLAKEKGQAKNAKLAEVYLLLGVAAIAGKNDMYRGVHAFVRGLRLDPAAKLPKRVVTPELKRVFASARRTVKALGAPPRMTLAFARQASGAAAKKKWAKGLAHSPIDEAQRGYPVVVKAATGVELRAKRLYLYFRPAGKVEFRRVEMQRQLNVYRGSIPAQFTRGRYVHYFIEARDPRGRVVASNGSARGPNVVIIKK